MSEERPVEPFSDLHVDEGKVRAVLLHDPTVEGLDMAMYLDGSASMSDNYAYKDKRSFFDRIFGNGDGTPKNEVEPHARTMLEYLATKDRNGKLRVAYWAGGSAGSKVTVVGEIEGKNAKTHNFGGPRELGSSTNLTPAINDFVEYMREQVKAGAKRGCAIFITDGQLHDADEVKRRTATIAKDIARGALPRMSFVLVGVGPGVDEEQLEDIAHGEYQGVGHIWCHRIAGEIKQLPELVAVLVDETMTVAAGGTIYDDRDNVIKTYEGRLPAVLEFDIREGAESFTLEVNGKRYTQPLPEDEDHH